MNVGLRIAGIGTPTTALASSKSYIGMMISTFPQASPNTLYILGSVDGVNFSAPSGVTNPVFNFPGAGGIGTSTGTQASSVVFDGTNYWVAYEFNNGNGGGGTNNKFGIAKSTSLAGPWVWVTDVVACAGTTLNTNVWNPRWFVDDNGLIYIIANVESGVTYDTAFQPVILSTTDPTFVTWSAPSAITGSFPPSMIDTFMVSPLNSPNGKYNLWFKVEDNPGNLYIEYASSSSLTSGFTVTKSGNWASWGEAEGPILENRGDRWRLYLISPISGALHYSDSFDNWATWSAIAPIVSPITNPGTGSLVYRIP